MPKYPPLSYRDTLRILQNLNFTPAPARGTSHQTWLGQTKGQHRAVTLAFHGKSTEFKRGTLSSIIRQSGLTKEEFYRRRKK